MNILNFFKKTKKVDTELIKTMKSTELRQNLYREICEVARNLGQSGMYSLKSELDKIANTVLDQESNLVDEDVERIRENLAEIKKYCNSQYKKIVLKRISKISDILLGGSSSSNTDDAIDKMDDKILELYVEMGKIEKAVSNINEQQEKFLGKDKIKWEDLNTEKKRLQSKYLVIEKSYKTLLTQKLNLGIASDLELAKEISGFIDCQNTSIDLSQVRLDATINREIADNTIEMHSEMESILTESYCQTSNDYEYEHALEAKTASNIQIASQMAATPSEVLDDGT